MVDDQLAPRRSNVAVDRGMWEQAFDPLWSFVGYHEPFSNNVFELTPSTSRDCSCSFQKLLDAWERLHPHRQSCFQVRYEAITAEVRLTTPRVDQFDALEAWAKYNNLPKGKAAVLHCDCGVADQEAAWVSTEVHESSCASMQPNFVYKPTGYTMWWNRFPFRDAHANVALDIVSIHKLIAHCCYATFDDYAGGDLAAY
jgi:hypothetical protein